MKQTDKLLSFEQYREKCLGDLRKIKERVEQDMRAVQAAETTEDITRILLASLEDE